MDLTQNNFPIFLMQAFSQINYFNEFENLLESWVLNSPEITFTIAKIIKRCAKQKTERFRAQLKVLDLYDEERVGGFKAKISDEL